MDVFSVRNRLVHDYADYVESFISISDTRIGRLVHDELERGLLWPEPLIQLNPTFEPGDSVDELVGEGVLHPECARYFRMRSSNGDEHAMRFHRHQSEAIRKAREGDNYVLTTGTGSGKSLAYIVPIVDHVLRNGSGRGDSSHRSLSNECAGQQSAERAIQVSSSRRRS